MFCVVSKSRPDNVDLVHTILSGAPEVAWFVGADDVPAYEKNGAKNVFAGGGLCASRNAALAYARSKGGCTFH